MPRRAVVSDEESASDAPAPVKKQVPKKRGRPSQKRANHDDDEDDEDAEEVEPAAKGKKGGGKKSANAVPKLNEAEIQKKAQDLVRLALANELSRKPLKRDDINKKVLGQHSRSFHLVLKIAQTMLSKTFGMELVELRAKGTGVGATIPGGPARKSNGGGNAADDSDDERVGGAKTKKTTAPKSYILRSKLKTEWLSLAAAELDGEDADENEELNEEKEGEGLAKAIEVEETTLREWRIDPGSLIDWKRSDQIQHLAILYVILGLILVNNRRCADDQLRVYLKRVNLRSGSAVTLPSNPSAPLSASSKLTLDKFLVNLTQQGYLERLSNKTGGGKLLGGNTNDGSGVGDPTMDWLWGPRADAEVGEEAISEFMIDFFKSPATATTEKAKEEFRAKRKKEIAKAAGSALLEARQEED